MSKLYLKFMFYIKWNILECDNSAVLKQVPTNHTAWMQEKQEIFILMAQFINMLYK